MSEDWGPWIEHDGRGVKPYGAGVYAKVEFGAPDGAVAGAYECISESPAGRIEGWHVDDYPEYYVVIRYRIRKPRGMVVLESLIADLPER